MHAQLSKEHGEFGLRVTLARGGEARSHEACSCVANLSKVTCLGCILSLRGNMCLSVHEYLFGDAEAWSPLQKILDVRTSRQGLDLEFSRLRSTQVFELVVIPRYSF